MIPFLHPGARLIDGLTGRELAGDALVREIHAAAERMFALPPGLMLSVMPADARSVIRYLAALLSRRPIALLDPGIRGEALLDLVNRFTPAIVAGPPPAAATPDGYRTGSETYWIRAGAPPHHPELGVLLATSGSTGNPKLVRLSRPAVAANARAVAQALGLTPGDLWPTTLSLHYTYGLTTLNAHLAAGGGVLVTGHSLLDREFWELSDSHGATSLAAVPYHFEILARLRFDAADHPKLRMITQAGGRLSEQRIADFARRMAVTGGHLVKMYGMTEAPRMSVLAPERLADKIGSVGTAIPGGALSIDDGEVVYEGPNVMMGYAECGADLARGDDLCGVIRTGDLGHLDDDGFLYLDGRIRRIGKVFGVRVNLDDVERMLAGRGLPVAVVGGDDRLVVWAEGLDRAGCAETARELAAGLRTHPSGIDVRGIGALPLLPTGKIDYRTLENMP
ncbi:acyl-CoA synthetase (AMP-forming)/AMP-acid ligase II [Thermocatellispora tengchongensis]|uniref:Acyl-CoA synthetase (AMP-forming)/AMP-acid ligase II n=1 Tax=Thermocatellispora tengchongensis TaxID=1073253 RepID=A0A840PK98_9ACTN|nr:AMP-binding protein [Thermocatellispora tengchongensis]MBB5139346.1 acyl-CoA synthetase (AMP-forming)/AMP-acid ligase II [Thermocatellispora tengchongensis]